MDPDFGAAIARCIRQIPRGRVATCGAIARALGDVRAARAVAMWVTDHPKLPGAHRVVRADGRPILRESADRLSSEGTPLLWNRVPSPAHVDSLAPSEFLTALRKEQRRLAARVHERDEGRPLDRVAGVDVSYHEDRTYVAAVSMDVADLEALEIVTLRGRARFPYIPTYLAYREFPAIDAALDRLSERPDLLMIDGHGRLHPTLFGVACHAGVALDLPTIGIAKHPLVGRIGPSVRRVADARPVRFEGRIRGYAWTPPGRSQPIYVSVGHRISLQTALSIVRETTRSGYPEPLRIADRMSREMKRKEKRERGATQ